MSSHAAGILRLEQEACLNNRSSLISCASKSIRFLDRLHQLVSSPEGLRIVPA
jgi:hypothetical protein